MNATANPRHRWMFDWEPLEQHLIAATESVQRAEHHHSSHEVAFSARKAAEAMGRPKRAVYRYRSQGVPFWQADRIATHLGCHPSQIWGDDWWRAVSIEMTVT